MAVTESGREDFRFDLSLFPGAAGTVEVTARNEAMKEHDLAPLRQAIIDVVRQTTMKVLICPEDETQMALGKEMLLEKLPADVRAHVVWRSDF
jgi:hypothetical protein